MIDIIKLKVMDVVKMLFFFIYLFINNKVT